MKKEEKENALFFQRVAAFILDIMIVSTVVSLFSFPFLDGESIEKLNASSVEISEQFVGGKIDAKTYMTESVNISYEMAKKNGTVTIITIFLNILYFVIFQFYRNGQTLGKKILRIQVVSTQEDELTMNQMIFRSLIINFILVDMITFGFVIFANKTTYFYGVGIMEMIQYLVIVISAGMVMFSKKSQGIHDLIAHTKVVRTDAIKELEVCES